MRRPASLALVLTLAAGPALSWSCASDEPLVPQVSASERARISAEVAAERTATDCLASDRADCRPALPFAPQPVAARE